MARRIFPLLLIVLLLPALLAVPARADDDVSIWLNLLDWTTANDSGSNFVYIQQSGDAITYDVPGTMILAHVDIVFRSMADITGVSFGNGWGRVTAGKVTSFGDYLYRVTCDVWMQEYDQLYIYVNYGTEGLQWVEFVSVDVTNVSSFFYEANALGSFTVSGTTYTLSTAQSVTVDASSSSTSWQFTINPYDCKKYDYVKVFFELPSHRISSVACDYGTIPIPYDVTYFDQNASGGKFRVCVTLDLRNIDRDLDYDISIIMAGHMSADPGVVSILSCTGYVLANDNSLLPYYFGNLHTWFNELQEGISLIYQLNSDVGNYLGNLIATWGQNIVTATNGVKTQVVEWGQSIVTATNEVKTQVVEWGQSIVTATNEVKTQVVEWGQNIVAAINGDRDPSQLQDDLNDSVGALQQAGAAMDAVERPDIGHVNIDVAGMVDPVGISGVASIVTVFTSNSLIYTIMLMFITLSLISYILYGKG